MTVEGGWTFAPFEPDYERLRQGARVEYEIPLSPVVRVSFDLSALFSTPVQANIDGCGVELWPQVRSYVAITQATGSIGEHISYRAEPVYRSDISSTPVITTHVASWAKAKRGHGGWARLSVGCDSSNELSVRIGVFKLDAGGSTDVTLAVGAHAAETSQWHLDIAIQFISDGKYGYSLRSPDPEELIARMRGASVVRVRIPSIGFGPVDFDIEGMFDSPVQGNIDECGQYAPGETRRLRANADACANGSASTASGETGMVDPSGSAPSEWIEEATRLLTVAYRASAGAWSGFDPTEHQVVLPLRSADGQFNELLAISVSAPESLGKATPLSTAGTSFCSLARVEDLNEETLRVLNQIRTFDIQVSFGPRATGLYVMPVSLESNLYSPYASSEFGWSDFVMHELFHHYQRGAWAKGSLFDQDFEHYAYRANNFELAALEDRALQAAAVTSDAESRLQAARHFSAIRLMRTQQVAATIHDERQERFEGSARFLERQLGLSLAEDGSGRLRSEYEDLLAHVLAHARHDGGDYGVREYFAFFRHYETGAAILRLLQLLGAADFVSKIEGGKSPAQVLIEYLRITDADVERLVAEARTVYDPVNELPALAVRLAAVAAEEDWAGPR